MAKVLKFGFVGAGFVADFHAKALKHVRGVELAGIYALQGAKELAKTAKALGIGRPVIYPSIATMAQKVDALAVFAPNFARVTMMEAIAVAKRTNPRLIGVVCEKPLARNLKEAEQVCVAIAGAGLRSAYFENQIFMPTITASREQLAAVEKSQGSPLLARSAEEHGGPHKPWFWDPTQQGGGVLLDMGCHSVAVAREMLTPQGKPPNFLQPVMVTGNTQLLKWRGSSVREKCLREGWVDEQGQALVDYLKTPAEDYATAIIVFRNPETNQLVVAQINDSWMYAAPALRLSMEVIGTTYSYNINTLTSPARAFVSDAAAEAVTNAEKMAEKAQASRGDLTVLANEPELYGYSQEWRDVQAAFLAGQDGYLTLDYGREITAILMAAYLSAEEGRVINLEEPGMMQKLLEYVPAIQQGKGHAVLGVSTACLGCG